MRFRKIDRFLLLLAGFFVLAVLRRSDLPGEEVLPDLYRAAIHEPLLAQASGALAGPEQRLVRLESELASAKHEIAQLKQQLSSRQELAHFLRGIEWPREPVAHPAWVFAVDSDVYVRNFQINVGRSSHVAPGMPVVTGKALLGRVRTVHRRIATVRRVDDPNFRIEVEIAHDGGYARGVAVGTGARGLEVRFLRAAGKLKKGTPAFTSSHDPAVPPGLLVGWIESVEDTERDAVFEVSLTPAASLGRLAQVEVLELPK